MLHPPILLPFPRNLEMNEGAFRFVGKKLICLAPEHPQRLLFTAERLQKEISDQVGITYDFTASNAVPEELIGITFRKDSARRINPQGYEIKISPGGILITAGDDIGLYYGSCTLIQLIQYSLSPGNNPGSLSGGLLPCMEISDWPDFINRGYLLDISRDKVPSKDTLYNLVDLLASWKINQLQLYTEHTFAYQNHPEVWAEASPFTGGEVLALDAYCRQRFIELVPNQNSFGHLEHWLRLPRYRDLAEAPDGFDMPWGEHHPKPFGLCPIDPHSIDFLSGLYDELLPHFTSRQFNVGCDETFDLGRGRSTEACAQQGLGVVYLNFLLQVYREVSNRGFTMQFWGDIIMEHPELMDKLPRDCIALEWGYDADHPFNEHSQKFAQAGLPFCVCPGTSAWNSIAGRTDNCLQNISSAAIHGMKHGAIGLLNTDWGDDGHWQVLPVSYLGIAAGAAYTWAYAANHRLDIRAALNQYAFQDPSGHLGNIAYDLGNLYREVGIELENTSPLFVILQRPMLSWREYLAPETAPRIFHNLIEKIDQIAANINSSRSQRPDHDLLQREFQLTADLLRHACQRALFTFGEAGTSPATLAGDLQHIMAEYKSIWHLRNRPGGFEDSLAHFNITMGDYR